MYYFKTKHKIKRGTGYVDVWRFTGIISPERADCMIMSTTKCTDAIHHTEKELELVKYKLTNRGYRWRVFESVTDNEIIDNQNSLTCI